MEIGSPPIKLGQLGIVDLAEVEKALGKPLSSLGDDGGVPWEVLVSVVFQAAKKCNPEITRDDLNNSLTFQDFIGNQEEILRFVGFTGAGENLPTSSTEESDSDSPTENA